MTPRAAVLACVAVALPGPGAASVERAISIPRPGKVVVTLDAPVYESARPDLGDLRVLDSEGRQVPYLLDQARERPEPEPRRPRILNRSFARGHSARATLDFGAPVLKTDLALSLSGDNFRRRVMVEGRQRHEREWAVLTDGAYVFAVPEPYAARYETVHLSENNDALLRVTVFGGPDDADRIEIRDAWVAPRERRRPREAPVSVRHQLAQDPERRETLVTLDLGARHQPFRAVVLDVADARFFRGVVVEARRESPPPAPGRTPGPLRWERLAEDTVYRYEDAAGPRDRLRIEAVGRERVLRLRIRNRDDRPLDVRSATVMTPVEQLAFEAAPGEGYRLSYGVPERAAPAYDVERTVGDAAVWIAQAEPGELGEEVPRPGSAAFVPWTERHPALLWSGLVTLVAALGGVTWRALRAAGGAGAPEALGGSNGGAADSVAERGE